MKRIGRRLATVLTLTLVVATTACGSSDGDGKSAATETTKAKPATNQKAADGATEATLVGKVEGTDALVGIETRDGKSWVYVCDSEKIWESLDGAFQGDELRATGIQSSLIASKSGEGVTGTVKLPDGTEHEFSAVPATGQAGVYYRGAKNADSYELTTWIRLADGETRGKKTVTTATNGGAPTAQSASVAGAPPAAGGPVPDWRLIKCLRFANKFNKAADAFDENPSGANQAAFDQASSEWEEACGLNFS
jgi:hypothetical protein